MSALSLQLIEHEKVRVIQCCLCGREWEEHWFAITLFESGELLMGSVCPACVSRSPREMADLLRREGDRLTAALAPLERISGAESTELLVRVRRVCAETQRLCAAARGLVQRGGQLRKLVMESAADLKQHQAALASRVQRSAAAQRAGRFEPGTAAELTDDVTRADEQALTLNLLADYLSATEPWSVTLRDAIDKERGLFAERFPNFGDVEARRVVDARYENFLGPSA